MPSARAVCALAPLLAACSIQGEFDGSAFRCEETPRCPDGQVCVDGLCAAPPDDAGPLPDAGDPTLAAWTTTEPLPEARDYSHQHAAAVDGNLYYAGGFDGAAERVEVYAATPSSDDGSISGWIDLTPLPAPRAYADVAVVGDVIYLVGGAQAAAAQTTVYAAQVAGAGTIGAWETRSPLPAARKGHVVVVVDDHLYAIGGEDAAGEIQATAFVAPIEEDGIGAWAETAPCPEPRANAAGAYASGSIFLMGGVNPSSTPHATVFAADVQEGGALSWRTATALPTPTRSAAAFALHGNVYLIGGIDEGGPTSLVFHSEVGDSLSWQTNATLPAPLARHAVAVLAPYIYVVGGGSEVYVTRVGP